MSNTSSIPRPEHPRPQFQRKNWYNLNGAWTYCFDFGMSGSDPGRTLFKSKGFQNQITVPFCPESKLSGVGYKDFIEQMWYHRRIEIPAHWKDHRILLHFGAVDYEAEVFIDGASLGMHFGGTSSFTFDLTAHVQAGATHHLVLRAHDHTRDPGDQPRGKQCGYSYKSAGCHYTRTTGIWQTVWMEAVDPCGVKDCHIIPQLDHSRFIFVPTFHGTRRGYRFRVTISENGKDIATEGTTVQDGASVSIALKNPRPWAPETPFLYDFLFEVLDNGGKVLDTVRSYGGLRKIHIEGDRVFLNNRPLYQRLVLDQGFYPDGVWTAPTDADLKRDIELSMQAGFNGARLHQKVFEERFHYWADKLGYLTWAESSSWGADPGNPLAARNFLAEWREIVVRDRNHPSIIAWTPFNETDIRFNPPQLHRTQIDAYELAKALDPTRPVNDASGWHHSRTDLWTVHCYDRPDVLKQRLEPKDSPGGAPPRAGDKPPYPLGEIAYSGQPYFCDEFGGLKWIPPQHKPHADNTWGYGADLKDAEEFYKILGQEVDILLSVEKLSGYCYTQLTDVEQEQNGIYTYDRQPKFDMARIAKIFRQTPPGFLK